MKNKTKMEHCFEFPASYGFQGDTYVLLMTVPGRTLTRVLASDNYGHTLERSQREINKARVKKFHDYLVNSEETQSPFIIPPLVGNCDSDIEFEPFGNTNVGIVRFPMDAEIKLFDGQHRAAGISEFCRNHSTSVSVPLMLTQKLSLKIRQQFFSDINNNVSKPSAAINMAYNARDNVSQEMVKFLSTHAVFSEITDFEHNVVPAKSDLWVSFKPLCDATAKFSVYKGKTISTGDIFDIWEAWLTLTAIKHFHYCVPPAEYKRDCIQFHAVMINAFGFAIQELIKDHTVQRIVMMIEDLATKDKSFNSDEFFEISNWAGICATTDKEKPTVIASIPAQRAAGQRLVAAIKNASKQEAE